MAISFMGWRRTDCRDCPPNVPAGGEGDGEKIVKEPWAHGRVGKREEGRGKREEGRGKREEGRGKREEGRGKKEEGRGKKEEGRGKREEGREKREESEQKGEVGSEKYEGWRLQGVGGLSQ
ncbi:MAG: hypothetical protein IPL76_07200 [Gemmatimonadetes bacterium]|nr:hypothetical protein [Gemmatimonadota bacterium]